MARSKGPRAMGCAAAAAALAAALRGEGQIAAVQPGVPGVPAALPSTARARSLGPAAGRLGQRGEARPARRGRGIRGQRTGAQEAGGQPDAAQQPRRAAFAAAAALCCGLAAAVGRAPRANAASADEFASPGPGEELAEPAKDLQIPPLPEAEVRRRRTTDSLQVKNEKWFKLGQRSFKANCSGCHPIGLNSGRQENLLSTENMERTGYTDPKQIQYIIRYGSTKMPGYAADCADVGDNAACQSIVPISEERLRDLQDFVMNRAASGWKDLS